MRHFFTLKILSHSSWPMREPIWGMTVSFPISDRNFDNSKSSMRKSVWDTQTKLFTTAFELHRKENWNNCTENITPLQWKYQRCTSIKGISAIIPSSADKRYERNENVKSIMFSSVLTYAKTIEIIGWERTQMLLRRAFSWLNWIFQNYVSWVYKVQSDWFFPIYF